MSTEETSRPHLHLRQEVNPAAGLPVGYSFRSNVTHLIYDLAKLLSSKPATENTQEFIENEVQEILDSEVEQLYFRHFTALPQIANKLHPEIDRATQEGDPSKGIKHAILKVVTRTSQENDHKNHQIASGLKEETKIATESYLWALVQEGIMARVKEIPGGGEAASMLCEQKQIAVDIRRDALQSALAAQLQFYGKSPAFATSEANAYAHTLKQMTESIFASLPRVVRSDAMAR